MITLYLICSTLVFAGLSFIWSSRTHTNVILKLAMFGLAFWGLITTLISIH